MGGDIGEIKLGSEGELYKYINHYVVLIVNCLKKNQTTPRPSEHPPVMGGKNCCCCLHIKNRSDLYPVPFSFFCLTLQGKETDFRRHKPTQNKVQKNNDKNKKDPEKVPTFARKI